MGKLEIKSFIELHSLRSEIHRKITALSGIYVHIYHEIDKAFSSIGDFNEIKLSKPRCLDGLCADANITSIKNENGVVFVCDNGDELTLLEIPPTMWGLIWGDFCAEYEKELLKQYNDADKWIDANWIELLGLDINECIKMN